MGESATETTFDVEVDDQRVSCGEGQPLLDALLRGGVWMPNSCNQGTCGTCKVRVVEGAVDHDRSPLDTLSDQERGDGLALACQARPCSDVRIATLGRREGAKTHPLRDIVATVESIDDVARDTRRVVLHVDEPLTFSAGQYVELQVPGTGARRQYSIASPPGADSSLELHVRRVAGGIASDSWLFGSIAVGDMVDVSGPLGDFRLPEESDDEGEPMVLIGGGTGLAPLKSIVLTALARRPDREIRLYHGVRAATDLYDVAVFTALQRDHAGFSFVPVLSEEAGSTHRSGFPTDAFADDIESGRGRSGWLCGPPALVDAGVRAFKRRRMAPRAIHRERFDPADSLDKHQESA